MRLLAFASVWIALAGSASAYSVGSTCVGPTKKIVPAFADAGLVPPTVPAVDDQTWLAVKYNSSAVTLGNFFNQSDTSTAPAVHFVADHRKNYTLIMVDPDVPAQFGPQIRHWIVSDLKPSCKHDVVLSGTTQSTYASPAPQGDAPFHRYALYLFEQPASAAFPQLNASIINFVIQDYVKEVGLKGPITGNFFKVADNGQNE